MDESKNESGETEILRPEPPSYANNTQQQVPPYYANSVQQQGYNTIPNTYQGAPEYYNSEYQNQQPKIKKKFPLALKIVIPVLAVLLVIAGAAAAFWRPVAIAVMGTKNYYWFVEMQNLKPDMSSLATAMTNQHPQYNTYDITGKTQMNNTDYFDSGIFENYASNIPQMLSNSSYEIKFGKNAEKKSLVANINWKYKGSSLLTVQGYINKDMAVVNSPELLKENFYVKSTDDEDMKPLFDFSDKLATSKSAGFDKNELAKAFNDLATQASDAVNNQNVSITSGVTSNIGGNSIKCDKIVIKLSQAEVRSTLHRLLDSANKNKTIKAYVDQYSIYTDLIKQMNKNDDITNQFNASYDDLSQAIDDSQTTGLTMTLLVKNHLTSSEILSRDIKMDSGDEISYYSVDGNGSIRFQNKNDSSDSNNKTVINFINTSSEMTGTIYSLNDGETIQNASNKLSYTIDKKVKTDLGYPVSQFDLVTKNDESNVDYNVTVSSDSGKTKIVTVMKDSGKAQFTETTTLSGSNEILKVPDFDKSNSIDPVTDESKLSNVYLELETNLSSIMQKMGISPSF